MLESVLHKRNKKQRRYLYFRNFDGKLHFNGDFISIAQSHYGNIILQKLNLPFKKNCFVTSLIQHITHQFGKLYNRTFRLPRINIYQCVDIIQRIHKKMRVYLILQILQFGLQALVFQFLQHFFIAKRLEEKFNGYIKSYHKKGNHKMNKIANCDRRIKKRNRFKERLRTLKLFHGIFHLVR